MQIVRWFSFWMIHRCWGGCRGSRRGGRAGERVGGGGPGLRNCLYFSAEDEIRSRALRS